MDVFKTHVGEGKALMINEENFYLATRERKPYVVDSGGGLATVCWTGS